MEFSPTSERRGVGEHPHRGFEKVTIVYEDEGRRTVDECGLGLVHDEFHGRDFARRGRMFEMVQLWVNLPTKDKKAPPVATLTMLLISSGRCIEAIEFTCTGGAGGLHDGARGAQRRVARKRSSWEDIEFVRAVKRSEVRS